MQGTAMMTDQMAKQSLRNLRWKVWKVLGMARQVSALGTRKGKGPLVVRIWGEFIRCGILIAEG